jgi:AcrR family transcriptional regulator
VKPPGLRERKKARTRAELQRHALRLFRDRGYAATTVDDIAAAAEVSRSTFFRYFPTKEDVVLFDDVDPLMEQAFAEQPAGTPLLTALRQAFATAFARLPPEERELEEVRMGLARTVPEVAAAMRERGGPSMPVITEGIAAEIGRDPDDLDVVLFIGVVNGARLAAQALVEQEPGRSYVTTLESLLARLEQGIPLADLPLPAAGRPGRRG